MACKVGRVVTVGRRSEVAIVGQVAACSESRAQRC
jgi:hypothetical protein